MQYKSVVVTRRGGPEVLKVIENDLMAPSIGKARIKIQATPVCQDDIAVRVGNRPFLAKPPFVPGYSILGVVDAIGEGVNQIGVGDRVAALTNFGGYAEYIYLDEEQLVIVPGELDPAEAVILILNYLVPFQILHRVAKVNPGDKVLIIGASGGVGTAFLQLGKLAKLTLYGLASESKHSILTEYGAIPVDYNTEDFVEVIRKYEPGGLDFVFNGMGEEYFERGLELLSRGGMLVHYGGPQSFARFILLVAKLFLYTVLPNGKAIKGYGTHRSDNKSYKGDWQALFSLLGAGKIKPIIAKKYPILEAEQANRLLESGKIIGNVVLLSSDLF
jgi:NADPH:quinone reductase-like Zn-dependent oxidoreductase